MNEMIDADGVAKVCVHWTRQSEGKWEIVCIPGLEVFGVTMTRSVPFFRSDDIRAVTCPMCLEISRWK